MLGLRPIVNIVEQSPENLLLPRLFYFIYDLCLQWAVGLAPTDLTTGPTLGHKEPLISAESPEFNIEGGGGK